MSEPLPWWTPGVFAAVCAVLCTCAIAAWQGLRVWRAWRANRLDELQAAEAEKTRALLRYLSEEGGSRRGGFLP